MKKINLRTNVLVIGSSAAGLVAALTGKRVHPSKKFKVVTRFPKTLIPCEIPYIFGSAFDSDISERADVLLKNRGVNIMTGTAVAETSGNGKADGVKLVVGRESGVILGGEVYGGLSAGELTSTLGIIVQNRKTLNSLLTAQFGTHSLLTASPAGYPLVNAAEIAASKIMFR